MSTLVANPQPHVPTQGQSSSVKCVAAELLTMEAVRDFELKSALYNHNQCIFAWLEDINTSLSIPELPVVDCTKTLEQPDNNKLIVCVHVHSELPPFISDAIHHQLHLSIGCVSAEWIIKDLPHPIENPLVSPNVLQGSVDL